MARWSYRKIDGEWTWINRDEQQDSPSESVSPFIHQDSMNPLKHPVTGEVTDSRTRWNDINKAHGLKVVGNDVLSRLKRKTPERITEELVLDRIKRAEAIVGDPTKRRARENENIYLYEQRQKLLNGR